MWAYSWLLNKENVTGEGMSNPVYFVRKSVAMRATAVLTNNYEDENNKNNSIILNLQHQ